MASKVGFRLFNLNRWSMAYAAVALMGLSACTAVTPISTVDDPVEQLIEFATHNDLLDEKNVLAALGGSFSLEPNPGQFDWIQYDPLLETRLARAELSYKVVKATGSEYVGILIKNLSTFVCYNRENLIDRLNAQFSSRFIDNRDGHAWTLVAKENGDVVIYVGDLNLKEGCVSELAVFSNLHQTRGGS